MSDQPNHSNEFARLFSRTDLLNSERVLELSASAEECRLLAARLGVAAINSLGARLQVTPWRRNGFTVSGDFRASVVQCCVVSLEEFEVLIEQTITVRYTDAADPVLNRGDENEAEIVVDPLDEDEIEILQNGAADLGELVVECLATELDPHPRKPGSDFENVLADVPASLKPSDEEEPSPFAVLSRLKRPQDE